ncbi:hypothetical protein OAG39_01875 [Verrucomicrobiales bacterium]|nr:hypothetical protein [Verrucomicrobiales bacterium]
MARSVGENIEKNPTAISRPEGGWFARIWNERSKSEKLLISLDRSEAFTVWVRSIGKCKDLQFLDEVFSSSVESRGNDDCISEAEFISLPPSKAFSVWTKISEEQDEEIPTLPIEAFDESQTDEDKASIRLGRDNLISLTSKCFTIWITPVAVAESKFVKIELSNNEAALIEDESIIDSVSEYYPEESSSREKKLDLVPIVFSILLVAAIIWMFVRANELASVKGNLASVTGNLESANKKISLADKDLVDKEEKISDLEKALISERDANKKASLNAKEVARIKIQKANEAFLGKVKEVGLLVKARDKIKDDYEKSKALNMKEVQELKSEIANVGEKNKQAQAQILLTDKNNESLTQKVTSLDKEKSELSKAMSAAEAATKKALNNYMTAIQIVGNDLKEANEMLEQEKSNSLMMREKLDLSDSQLKKLILEIERLNAKIRDLEQPDQPFAEK